MNILLAGMISAVPYQGGATWAVLQYLLGLRQLGHAVSFVEQIDSSALQPQESRLEDSLNARYFHEVVEQFGFRDTSALLVAETTETVGLPYQRLRALAEHTDLLINISGTLKDARLLESVRTRVYLDLDPCFTQMWQAFQGIDMGFEQHDHFVTVGGCIGQPDCPVPSCGVDWLTTLQPLVLSHWPRAEGIGHDALTTVAHWRGYGSIEHDGVLYGQKAHAVREFMDLPTRTQERFGLALGIHPGEERDIKALVENGWELLDPRQVAATPESYRRFVQNSMAEIGIAKSGYVKSRCGWFSDRSICYLASGRPVIAQQTGFDSFLPTGQGLFVFQGAEDVLEGIAAIRSDYDRQSRAARAIAEEYFNSDRVLSHLLENLGLSA